MVGLKGNIQATIDIYVLCVFVCVRACVRARGMCYPNEKKIIRQEQNKHIRVLLLFLCYKTHMPSERV